MLDLWLIRHAESFGNRDSTESDSHLTPEGRMQATALRQPLSSVAFDAVDSSPLTRARETATIAMPAAPVLLDARLKELNPGPGQQILDLAHPEALRRLLDRAPAEQGESGKDFMTRVNSWRSELPTAGSVVAFTHAAVVREVVAGLVGFRRAPQQVAHAAIFRLEVSADGVRVRLWNDASHLHR